MKLIADILANLSISLNGTNQVESKGDLTLLYVSNVDGSIRWIWPSDLKKALFLKFYAQDSFRSKVIAFAFKMVFVCRLQKIVFKNIRGQFEDQPSLIDLEDKKWALFTGTPGPNRKAVIYVESEGKGSFIKLAIGPNASELIKQEAQMIQHLDNVNPRAFAYPTMVNESDRHIGLEDISNGGRRPRSLNVKHLRAIASLNQYSSTTSSIGALPMWKNTKRILAELQDYPDARISERFIEKLQEVFDAIDPQEIVECGWMHGDFTPWNMYEGDRQLYIYDWELSQNKAPLGYDLFHFICQNGILVEKLKGQQIIERVQTELAMDVLKTLSPKIKSSIDSYFRLYLLFNTTQYLGVYSLQEEWHDQVYDLLSTWEYLITHVQTPNKNHRSELIIDLFHFLKKEDYAAVKFPNTPPEELNVYADIDLCLKPSLAKQIDKYLIQHPFVKGIQRVKKSFMWTLELTCKDGGKLSLDLLFLLKRRATVLSDLQALLASTQLNEYGVKVPSDFELARYIMLFYASNQTPIPSKYQGFMLPLNSSTDACEVAWCKAYQAKKEDIPALSWVKDSTANKGWSRAKHVFFYVMDTILGMWKDRGMIVTFSGVDGAGKSTIIEEVKIQLEKAYRKRVVVIRHRPSLLPILSAYTKGKKQAEKDAKDTLPRQGSNKSRLSSLIRFSYYYVDYFFGQFVIYYRHVLRGHIVLYDRYYFDFINDAKRSNINLPKLVTKLGYYFLLKPHFNFFLYAQPEIILSRKKELDHETIEVLTASYKDLFESLNNKSKRVLYSNIENVNLDQTLHSIFNTLDQKAA